MTGNRPPAEIERPGPVARLMQEQESRADDHTDQLLALMALREWGRGPGAPGGECSARRMAVA